MRYAAVTEARFAVVVALLHKGAPVNLAIDRSDELSCFAACPIASYLRIRRRCAPATSVRLRCAACNRINKGTAAVHRLDARINGAHRADFGQLELPLQLAACLILRVIG